MTACTRFFVLFYIISSTLRLLPYLSPIFYLANAQEDNGDVDRDSVPPLEDLIDDGIFDPFNYDASCKSDVDGVDDLCDGWSLPETTIEMEEVPVKKKFRVNKSDSDKNDGDDEISAAQTVSDFTRAVYGGDDIVEDVIDLGMENEIETVDKHWGADRKVLEMRDALRKAGQVGGKRRHKKSSKRNQRRSKTYSVDGSMPDDTRTRPPVFLIPGLASTRLVSWAQKSCQHPLVADIKMKDYVWLNVKQLLEMAGIDQQCWLDCMSLGRHQRDANGCRLRPDEGLDAIASLAPGNLGSEIIVGGTNTVYAWLIQWLAENLGYDVTSIIGLGYDWRLSPDVMEDRDGYFTMVKAKVEASVSKNGQPGIVVAHSMGNLIFRHFLDWLEDKFIQDIFDSYKEEISKATLPPNAFPGWLSNIAQKADEMRLKLVDLAKELNLEGAPVFRQWLESDVTDEMDEVLWEMATFEGKNTHRNWLRNHFWTYVGLSAPTLGAPSPTRSVISGETMGLPMTNKGARDLEITFGSTHTANIISTKMGFCYPTLNRTLLMTQPNNLACLDEVVEDIESSGSDNNPWRNFDVLRLLLKDRLDWDSDVPVFVIDKEKCLKGEKSPCSNRTSEIIGPLEVQSGEMFDSFAKVWKEENDPLLIKKEQLIESFWDEGFGHILNTTWDRPHIKHVIMAYGVDIPTEIGFHYHKKEEVVNEDPFNGNKTIYDDYPHLKTVIWEAAGGDLIEEFHEAATSTIFKRKPKKELMEKRSRLPHSGDGTIPYLSLAWAQTWLLHTARAYLRMSTDGEWVSDSDYDETNPLKNIVCSHRLKGGSDWIKGPLKERKECDDKECDLETGTSHPHGTKYKPEMVRFQSRGRSRETGIEYTTTVIEGIGIEHKETTRNYDILAAVFTDILKYLHDDFGTV